ncbi:hypothetical protein HK103_003755 [Boothiomyces macroporosus]|uniref:Cwf19-like C-terminal domain-containing protein n=1 Tax=Boothiomyces macroporosus TaxID=261099 RepID=A0AAD5ULT5_9FUNG|nr:hypothetical protein HK103_003755 [Boothiomyces macroporosus]
MGDSKRQGWMLDPQNEMTDVFRASGREKTNREIERERQQQESERIRKEREIKPIENSSRGYEYGDKGSSWRMMKLKRVFDIAKEEGVSVEKIALERYGVLEEYQEALKEREFLDLDKKSNQHGTKSNLKRPSFKPPSEFARPNKLEKSSHRNREEIDRDSSNSKKEEDDTVYRRRKDDSPTRKAPLPQAIAPVVKYELDEPVLSKDQLNKLHAKVLKAKMLKLPELEELEEEYYYELAKAESGDKIIVVPSVNSKGELHAPEEAITRNRNTHDKKGNRLGYEDEGEQTLDDLVRYEKLNKTSDFDKNLSHQIARDSTFKDDLDYMDDSSDRLSRKKKDKRDNSEKRAIRGTFLMILDYKKSEAALAECVYCYHDNQPPKITMISIGNSVYLALPETIDMVKYHCLIVPIQHANTTLELDDQAWDEIRVYSY